MRRVNFLEQLTARGTTLTVELRPPRMDQTQAASIDAWFTMHEAVASLVGEGTPIFLTDGAVGAKEEENLHHLLTNLDPELRRELVCPFLTTKHTLQYCQWFAARVVEAGCGGLTVLGGDKHVGPPRCVEHGHQLRALIAERFPGLPLGGWANPHRDAARQVAFVTAPDFHADFYLTQLVGHHDLPAVERFLAELQRQEVALPGVFGVFFYRSGRKKTLQRLANFFPVPVDGVVADFAAGKSPEAICAESIRALEALGVEKFYVSNLQPELASVQLAAIRRELDALPPL